jgi:hypothetical protein
MNGADVFEDAGMVELESVSAGERNNPSLLATVCGSPNPSKTPGSSSTSGGDVRFAPIADVHA